ncbi:MAG: hypothetical protein ABIT05_04220 [Chitinophagaceae bacterium]
MNRRSPVFFLSFLFLSFIAIAQKTDTIATHAFYKKAMSQINSKHINWVKSSAKLVVKDNLSESDVRNMASKYGSMGSLGAMDIEALVSLIMMQLAKDAQDDLKALMEQMKKNYEQKKKIRDILARIKKERNQTLLRAQLDSYYLLIRKRPSGTVVKGESTKPVTKEEIDELVSKMSDESDSLSEQGEQQQLRMQLVMDRMTKADEAASNALKKFSETANSIIQNLK